MESIRARQATIDEADGIISARLAEIATHLRAIISVRISVSLPGNKALGFGKLDGNWALLYHDGNVEQPLLGAPRHVRSEMFLEGHIQRLINDIPDQLNREIKTRTQAIEIADTIVGALTMRRAAAALADPIVDLRTVSPPYVCRVPMCGESGLCDECRRRGAR